MATFYASHFATPSPRSLLLLNSFSYVDSYLAGVLHDCMNIFTCAPESRPDLPVYFHARFLFSPAYLGQVNEAIDKGKYDVHLLLLVGKRLARVLACLGLFFRDMRSTLGYVRDRVWVRGAR